MPPVTLRKQKLFNQTEAFLSNRIDSKSSNIWEELCERRGQERDVFRMITFTKSTPDRIRLDTFDDDEDDEHDNDSLPISTGKPMKLSILRSQCSNDLSALNGRADFKNCDEQSCSSGNSELFNVSNCILSRDRSMVAEHEDRDEQDDSNTWGHFTDILSSSACTSNDPFITGNFHPGNRLSFWGSPYARNSLQQRLKYDSLSW